MSVCICHVFYFPLWHNLESYGVIEHNRNRNMTALFSQLRVKKHSFFSTVGFRWYMRQYSRYSTSSQALNILVLNLPIFFLTFLSFLNLPLFPSPHPDDVSWLYNWRFMNFCLIFLPTMNFNWYLTGKICIHRRDGPNGCRGNGNSG